MTVLLGVAHGSRDEGAQHVVDRLLSTAAALRPGLRAAAAYVDNAAPSIAAALARLVADGVDDIAVVPLLLTSASHAKTDIAGSVQAGRLAHPGLRLRYGRPLGPHPALVTVLARRLAEAGAHDDPVVLAAGGSLDPDANAQVAATARLLWEGRSFPSVDVAFASTTGPSVVEALERLRLLGFRRAAVARYFLGPGRLPRSVELAAGGVADLQVVVSAPLGVTDEIAGLLLERYDEARGGDIRMNCDACLYRVPFPGRESVVGAPQAPHSHPDDVAP
jgi:sirohydrochlorin cobaltochelatase